MSVRKLTIILLFAVNICNSSLGQVSIKGIIVEKRSKLPVAFASVTYRKGSLPAGVISDIHGKFEIADSDITSLRVSCVGYRENNITITGQTNLQNLVVELMTDTLSLSEVRITPEMNPAVRIMKKVLANKERNNYENYESYTYRCYLKTSLSFKLSYNENAGDSSASKKDEKLNRYTNFISESVVLSSSVRRNTENRVIAVRTSGFDNPLIGQYFVSVFHKAISFYNDNISLFALAVSGDMTGSEYLSPVSNECLRSYNFLLQETYENDNDTLYIIEFHPKKGSNFNGLQGQLYISSNGYAIKHIVTEPFEKGLIDFRFRQDYDIVEGRWFPVALDEEIGFASMKINKKMEGIPVYLVKSRIDDVSYNTGLSIDSISYEKVYLDGKSIAESDSILNNIRPDPLTPDEIRTITRMDSLGAKYKFDYWADLYPSLVAGKIPVKCFDIDIMELYRSNDYEGVRIGLSVSTNDKFSKIFSLGGFTGYGIKDRAFKYGGHVAFNIDPEREAILKVLYRNTLREPGRELTESHTYLASSEYLREYLASRMDKLIEKRAELSFRPFRHMKITGSVSFIDITPGYDYLYQGSSLSDFMADEIRVAARYAFREEIHAFGKEKIIFYEGNPVVSFTWKKGIDFFDRDSYNYNRFEASLDFTAYKGRIGQSDFRLEGGYIDTPLPYSLLFTGEGSKSSYPILIENSFQTMKPYEFLSDRYVNLFFTHNFGTLLLETPKFKPRIIVAHNTGWGTLRNGPDHGIDFTEKDRVFLESGLLINNIIRFKLLNIYYIGFGGGGFYRYGQYTCDKFLDNTAFKFSMTVALE